MFDDPYERLPRFRTSSRRTAVGRRPSRREERPPVGTVVDAAASGEFHAFFERHYAEPARLARLLTGEVDR
ncbi:hypothetical protein GCM10010389_62500 [Streptomyces echinoruber]|uniref:Uncharacterized protein n=1 Tax=Streptomyces echinoruber TaxID=68898 RepID=A0A918RXL7_9ACTN|nr:hypothetical protein GCM10010389_62500 [Streptomyces echinoruber]